MGKMSEYANSKSFETLVANGLVENFTKLLSIRDGLTSEIEEISAVLKDLHMELVNVDDMLFEIKEKLESKGIKVE